MSETKTRKSYRGKKRQGGVAAVEFAIIAVVFFTLLLGVIEAARLMFLFNTLPEVTRRAASVASHTDFTKNEAMNRVRQNAIFRDNAGGMILMNGLTDQSIRIDYMSIKRNSDNTLSMVPIPSAALPSSPAANRRECLFDPNSAACIRIVRARVCDASILDTCEPMQYQSLVGLVNLSMALPVSVSLVKAESLGL